ncbi:MAG: hypothetical protein Q4G43_10435 [Mobilicoccus sp.]|nr:hypothetical protein [Mobilicoccus sp.]
MKSHRSRLVAAGAALALTVTLGACGQADPGAAAHVRGETIPERDVQTAVTELAQLGPQAPMPGEVANTMVIGRLLEPNLAEEGIFLSDDDGRALLQQETPTQLSPATLDALRAIAGINLYNSIVQGQPVPGTAAAADPDGVIAAGERTQQQLMEGEETGNIVVNPRYRPQSVVDNWFVQQPDDMGQLPPGHP